jgi:hypothetical protein
MSSFSSSIIFEGLLQKDSHGVKLKGLRTNFPNNEKNTENIPGYL